jgi:hypothetical protein
MTAAEQEGPVVLRSYGDETEAHHARSLLAENGIDAEVVTTDFAGFFDSAEIVGGAQLLVRKADAERADKILQEVEEEPPETE